MYSMDDFVDNKPALKTVTSDYAITASDPEFIVLTPVVEKLASKHVDLWLNKAMTGFDKDVLIGSFDVYDGGYWYIAYSSLPEGISDEGFDVLYYGDNKDLVKREGVNLEGWVVEPDSDENMTGFLPDDFVGYNDLPAGDTINLYAVWYDPIVYGVTYHANRSSSDNYTVQSAQFSYDSNTLAITDLDENDEGLKNPDKTFVGWNTAADGSGEWVNAGETASLEKLGLGTRTEYVNDLAQLSTLQGDDEPSHYTEAATDTDSEADKYEAQLESKYTTHLYAQWKDKGNTPQATTAKTSAKTSATTTQSKTPVTGDAMMPIILFISVIVLAAAVVLITVFNKRRNKR